jgi:exodeoxyribonuclease VII small subunit
MTKKETLEPKSGKKFEESLQRLEQIVEKLEAGDVPLEDSLALYEEGIALFRQCSAKLEEAKKKVEILSKKGSSEKLQPEAFSPEKFGLKVEAPAGDDEDEGKEEFPF